MDNKKYDRLTKSLVYPLIEKYYSSGDLPSVFYKREGLSESQFYTWRQRYLRDHPSVAKKLGVAFKPDGDAVLAEKLTQTLLEMREDGTTAAIVKKYGLDAEKSVNGGTE